MPGRPASGAIVDAFFSFSAAVLRVTPKRKRRGGGAGKPRARFSRKGQAARASICIKAEHALERLAQAGHHRATVRRP